MFIFILVFHSNVFKLFLFYYNNYFHLASQSRLLRNYDLIIIKYITFLTLFENIHFTSIPNVSMLMYNVYFLLYIFLMKIKHFKII